MVCQEVLLVLCGLLSVTHVSCSKVHTLKREAGEASNEGMDYPLNFPAEARAERDVASAIKLCVALAPAVLEVFQKAFKMWDEGRTASLHVEACCQFYRNQTCFKQNTNELHYQKTLEECKDFSVTKHCSSASSFTISFWMTVVTFTALLMIRL